MADESTLTHQAGEPCPAGDDNCPNLSEMQKLQAEIKQLSALVRTDELTGLYNFRYFNRALGLEMERTRRSGQPCCLIIMDLDHFKAINDKHGHEAGNIVLSHIAGLINKTIRQLDIACRYGGEEFILILPNTTLKAGVRFANRLRLIIEQSPIQAGDVRLCVQASFGVDVYSPGDKYMEKEFIEKVDGFLYLAKQTGRNRVCHGGLQSEDGNQRTAKEDSNPSM
ncbi:MAG: GGDEF domain-containing protein [Gammaproteobacteria bacterium]|jgi:diguanylate cyclase (GGDEF)-like protein|nr:GGDEF domain-containing protein [Gammaproteobacteria bacterium]|tara:strand:- start:207 stop:881 length:675 start_codon:yes stop_codon:yes gene_type:complete